MVEVFSVCDVWKLFKRIKRSPHGLHHYLTDHHNVLIHVKRRLRYFWGGGREGGREGEREGGREGGRKGRGRGEGRGRKREIEGGREGGREERGLGK